ncbi:hypothetical protein CL647_06985 [bacterium]|nr:hypothetical protein [Actinomycetota bacterium]MBE33805.1 hypothetical protein [bacterium]|tara:strand:- start:10416 stop:10973 length:558 start_codon:yes stop_codon:yes gene_type:complete
MHVVKVMICFFMVILLQSSVFSEDVAMKVVVNQPFLAQSGESLAGNALVFPDHFKLYDITFVAYGFSRKSGDDFDSWLKPFQERYKADSNVFFVSIPMIGKLPKWILKQMKKGMKRGIDVSLHSHQMIYSGNAKLYQDYYGFSNKKRGYFFLVNSEGTIVWQGEGKSSDDLLKELFLISDSFLLK